MIQKACYASDIGYILLTAKDEKLVSLSFSDEKSMDDDCFDSSCLKKVIHWLDDYFSLKEPRIDFGCSLDVCTSFQKAVFEETMKIPYGDTITYQELAMRVKERLQVKNMSSQAIGQALKRNPIALVIPCHRVVGKKDNLVGYAYSIERKKKLLELERNAKGIHC